MLRSMIAGVRALLRPAERNTQIEEELRSFFQASVEDKIRSGMSPERAQRAARIEIGSGDMVRHKVWSASWESGVDSLVRELRLTFRQLRKSPGFTLNTPSLICSMRSASPYPCIDSRARVLSTSISNVP